MTHVRYRIGTHFHWVNIKMVRMVKVIVPMNKNVAIQNNTAKVWILRSIGMSNGANSIPRILNELICFSWYDDILS